MKHITFYLDFISPFAYLAFERLPQALMGCSYAVTHKPILFAALLEAHGQLGPAEIAPKRDWTYRQVLWLAQAHGIALDLPAAHPFNPLGLLRLAVACDAHGLPNRYVCETLFRHVWQGGADASDASRLHAVRERLAPEREMQSPEVKQQLKSNTDEALSLGVFGVPTFEVDGKLFWGLDALPMVRAYLDGHAWFDTPAWQSASQLPAGQVRRN